MSRKRISHQAFADSHPPSFRRNSVPVADALVNLSSRMGSFSPAGATRWGVCFESSGLNDPRQDDYDVWLGTDLIQPWIAYTRHNGAANYLYLDGHISTMIFSTAVVDMYPDKMVLVEDGSYPN